jgi:hypothetical protein
MSTLLSVIVALVGAALAVFAGGLVIAQVLKPFEVKLVAVSSERLTGLENAGRWIGWLERTLLYGLILAGAPDAAAIVIAAKSVARFPAFSQESFAEYYLIGTLLSFLIAAGLGVAVRGALGLHPLLAGAP